MAAESAADWFCNLTANQTPDSTQSALIPIRQGSAMATIVAVAPVWSRKIRASTLQRDRMESGDMFITGRHCSAVGFSVDGRPSSTEEKWLIAHQCRSIRMRVMG